MNKTQGRIVLIILGITVPMAVIGFLFVSFWGCESYCWWCPTIDTQFASQYSEKAFNTITPGMSQTSVLTLLGEPLFKGSIPQGRYPHLNEETAQSWHYTSDGKCSWSDWAWLGRYVYFDTNGSVTEAIKVIHYD